jgi:glycosyltransferase involved in cell wall biosynthesis
VERTSMQSSKALFVTELTDHGDEGMRNWIKSVARGFHRRGHETAVVHLDGDPRWSATRPRVLRSIRRSAPDLLIYVPYSGLTSKALVRHLALRQAARAHIDVLVTLQANTAVRKLPVRFSPTVGAFASQRLRDAHPNVSRVSHTFPPAVDSVRFHPSDAPRGRLRDELGLPAANPMVLHVGHLRRSRGLEPLAELASDPAITVVLIASTSTEPEADVVDMLQDSGVIIKREFLPDIHRWYQAADVYLFPVSDLQGSIEVPLTVLEALACGVPIVSTPFGGLPSLFSTSESFRFAPPAQLLTTAKQLIGIDGALNRSVVSTMTDAALIDAFERIVDWTMP